MNPRIKYVNIEYLAASIREHGLYEPIKLNKCACGKIQGEHYRVVDGHRRLRAIRNMVESRGDRLEDSEYRVFDLGANQEIAMMVETNLERDSYTPVEKYRGLSLKRKHGLLKRMAEQGGLNYGTTRNFLSVMDRLDSGVREKVARGRIEPTKLSFVNDNSSGNAGSANPASAASDSGENTDREITWRVAALIAKVDHEAQRTLAYMLTKGRLTPPQLREVITQMKEGKSLRDAINSAREAILAGTGDSKVAAAFAAFLVVMAYQTMDTNWLAELGFERHTAKRTITELRRAELLGTEGRSFNYFSPGFLGMSKEYIESNGARERGFARSVVDLLGMGEWSELRIEPFLDKIRKEAISQRAARLEQTR